MTDRSALDALAGEVNKEAWADDLARETALTETEARVYVERLDGHTRAEIAASLDLPGSEVEEALQTIREKWIDAYLLLALTHRPTGQNPKVGVDATPTWSEPTIDHALRLEDP